MKNQDLVIRKQIVGVDIGKDEFCSAIFTK